MSPQRPATPRGAVEAVLALAEKSLAEGEPCGLRMGLLGGAELELSLPTADGRRCQPSDEHLMGLPCRADNTRPVRRSCQPSDEQLMGLLARLAQEQVPLHVVYERSGWRVELTAGPAGAEGGGSEPSRAAPPHGEAPPPRPAAPPADAGSLLLAAAARLERTGDKRRGAPERSRAAPPPASATPEKPRPPRPPLPHPRVRDLVLGVLEGGEVAAEVLKNNLADVCPAEAV